MARKKNVSMWINRENEMPEREEVLKLFCSGLRIMNIEAEEMIQMLKKALAAPTEDPSCISNTHVRQFTTAYN